MILRRRCRFHITNNNRTVRIRIGIARLDVDASSTRIGAEKGRVNVVAIGEVRGGGGLIEADG